MINRRALCHRRAGESLIEGLSVKEITKVLGCENATGARTLIQNARRRFARLIEEKGFGHV